MKGPRYGATHAVGLHGWRAYAWPAPNASSVEQRLPRAQVSAGGARPCPPGRCWRRRPAFLPSYLRTSKSVLAAGAGCRGGGLGRARLGAAGGVGRRLCQTIFVYLNWQVPAAVATGPAVPVWALLAASAGGQGRLLARSNRILVSVA